MWGEGEYGGHSGTLPLGGDYYGGSNVAEDARLFGCLFVTSSRHTARPPAKLGTPTNGVH